MRAAYRRADRRSDGHTCALLDNGKVRCWGTAAMASSATATATTSATTRRRARSDRSSLGAAPQAVAISAGDAHTCALLDNGAVRCWGEDGLRPARLRQHRRHRRRRDARLGRTGRSRRRTHGGGDQRRRPPHLRPARQRRRALLGRRRLRRSSATATPTTSATTRRPARSARSSSARAAERWRSAPADVHTCALLDNGAVRCWGYGGERPARLRQHRRRSATTRRPGSVGPVDLGRRRAVAISAGSAHTCALLDNGAVRCWGFGFVRPARLRQHQPTSATTRRRARSDRSSSAPGARRRWRSAPANAHTCALLDNGAVRCWGNGVYGQLGYGNTNNIGDNETPGLGRPGRPRRRAARAVAISAGGYHTCALLDNGTVRCWGRPRQLYWPSSATATPTRSATTRRPARVRPGRPGWQAQRTGGRPLAAVRTPAAFGHLVLLDLSLRNSGPDPAPACLGAAQPAARADAALWAEARQGRLRPKRGRLGGGQGGRREAPRG